MSSSTEIQELSSEEKVANVDPKSVEPSQSPASNGAQSQEIDQEPNDDLKRVEPAQSIADSNEYDCSAESQVESGSPAPDPPVQSDETAAKETDSAVLTNDQSAPEETAENMELNALNAKITLEEIEQLVVDLRQSLSDGQLKECISRYEKCQAKLRKLSEIGFKSKKLTNLQKTINGLYFGVRELKDWRHWGMDQARLDLIEKLKKLQNFQGDPRDLHVQIKEIRELWNSWNQTGDFPNRTLREKYTSAYEEAFKPCKNYFKEQKKQRKTNKNLRKEICVQLEENYEAIDWNRPNWASIGELIRNSRKQWVNAVPLNKKDWNSTNARFDEVMKNYAPHLERERNRGVRFRMDLIDKVNALENLPVKAATEKAKEYQQDWKTVVIRDKKKKENELWEQFRIACDKQFQRRNEFRKVANEKWQESEKVKKSLLGEIKKLNELPTDQVKGSASKATVIQRQWSTATQDNKRSKGALDTKFNHEISKFQNSVRKADKFIFEKRISVLESKAGICNELEMAIGKENCESTLTAYQKKWNSIEADCGEFEEAIQIRYATACEMLQNGSEVLDSNSEKWAENLEMKQNICLRLEILSEIESPPEFARERMKQNVERLNAVMTKQVSVTNPEEEIRELMVSYWLAGAVPSEAHELLKQRFNRIQAELSKS